MSYKLSEICVYAKDRVDVAKLNYRTYISTENMLPNKGGITIATTLPSVKQTQGFKVGDILVSNIRPYFRKIWKAEFEGGCSNDVLVFRAKKEVNKEYLYYVLSDDTFFEYSMATSKGTKMPRGDKKALMDYLVPEHDNYSQKIIASLLKPIDELISNNENINKNLEQQAQALFKAWFVDFEAFSGEKPNGWISAKLGNIAEISTSSFSPAKNPDAVVEHYSIPAFDEKKYPVFEVADDIKSNKYILSPNSVMISKLNPDTKRVWRPYCISPLAISSTEFIVFEAKNLAYRDFVYSIIDSDAFSNHMCAHTSGSTNSRQRTMPKTTLDFEFILPTEDVILDFCEIVTPMYNLIQANVIENQHLAEARDILLPKLMSGELDITEIDI